MAFLPSSNPVVEIDKNNLPSKTYKVDWKAGHIIGMVDGKEALNQAILKILMTARYKYIIYDNQYGTELSFIISQDYPEDLIEVLVEGEIREALLTDDRIFDVQNFEFEFYRKTAKVRFEVISIFGNIDFSNILVKGG